MSRTPLPLALTRTRSSLLLPALLLLAGLLFALTQFLVSDPGADGGSGIGGTGRFGGESGIGGTGGPVNFGALDDADENREDDEAKAFSAAAGANELASAVIDADTLRLAPVKPAMVPAPLPADELLATREALESTLARISEESFSRAVSEIDALKFVELDLASEREELDSRVRGSIEEDLGDTAREVIASSTEVTRELILAQAAMELEVGSDIQPPTILETMDSEAERRRVAVPVRPERPARPSLPAQRFTPAQRGIPTPPVRPMRI